MPSGCAALLTISRDQRRTVYRFPATRSRSLLTVEGALAKQSGFWEKRQGGIFRQRAPLDDISTESTALPWSGRAGRRDSGVSAGFFAFFT